MSAIRTVYVERQVAGHARTRAVLERLPAARVVSCERYGEVFNRSAQSFRIQKGGPALILAAKHDGHVLPAPSEYNVGGRQNYYFSHILNCPYDCRYCFLQGMFRSAHFVLFVNYEDFETAMDRRLEASPDDEVFFFSGYDCDSLALEGVTGFCAEFLPYFASRPRSWLELRTKSASVGMLEVVPPLENCVVAFSFTPAAAHEVWEAGVPSIERRLGAMRRLGERGWKLGLRFDPLVWWPECLDDYLEHIRRVFAALDPDWLHSVSLGAFRLPAPFFRRMVDMYPEERLFAAPLVRRDSLVSYREELQQPLVEACREEILRHTDEAKLFECTSGNA